MRIPALCLLLGCASAAAAPSPGSVRVDATQLDRLAALAPGATLELPAFPVGPGVLAPVRFERLGIYARDARIVEIGAHGERSVPPSRRIELIGTSADGSARLALAFDPDHGRVRGSGSAASGSFAITAEPVAGGVRLGAISAAAAQPKGVTPMVRSIADDDPSSGRPLPGALEQHLAALAAPAGGTPAVAVLAIDTDNEFMSERFGNDAGAAADWIADLFGVMNVMYQRDLDVRLVEGMTFLRTTTDPYSAGATPADQDDLDEFGTYWQTHYASVDRSFAMLLSGKSDSGNSASGIAWLNAYCETQSTGGAYSVVQVFTNPGITVDLSARVSGHELGHNFGAYHTHCTDAATGFAPTAVNTIDQCYNGEGDLSHGCYNGPTSCPATGPGHPLGTLMSYCNLNGCGQNVLQFHPTQITTLSLLIAANTPICLAPGGEIIFANGFD
jgi:hypothetical protein